MLAYVVNTSQSPRRGDNNIRRCLYNVLCVDFMWRGCTVALAVKKLVATILLAHELLLSGQELEW